MVASACFDPEYPVGLACDPLGWCPPGQVCNNRNRCVRGADDGGAVAFDADPTTPDADVGLGDLLAISIGDDVTIAVDQTHAFVVTGTYDNGTRVISDFAIWDSSDNAVMFIDFMGVAKGVAPGVATATCEFDGRVDTALVTVTGP